MCLLTYKLKAAIGKSEIKLDLLAIINMISMLEKDIIYGILNDEI